MQPAVHSLFVTLRRSLAGTREQHVRVVRSLGLTRREQTVEKPNNAAIRGAIDKVGSAQAGGSDWCRAAGWSSAGACERNGCVQAVQYDELPTVCVCGEGP